MADDDGVCAAAACRRGDVTSICNDACSVSTSADSFNVLGENGDEDDCDDRDKEDQSRNQSELLNNNFIKPLHQLSQLSGYQNLVMLYSIFCSLAVSSASAERALSKLKIIKNRLHSSLCDDNHNMLSSHIFIASEKDILHGFRNEDIINRMAATALSLKTELMHW